ncbi:MAG: hypothetical protein QXS32_08240 [Candidatus Nezhaarchaeales archaeon]
MAGGFKDLYLMVTIDVVTLCTPDIPVVVNGSSAINPGSGSAYWKFEFQDESYGYYYYMEGGSWSPQIWTLFPDLETTPFMSMLWARPQSQLEK